jgi:GNAT superfamily N-acetyltransferase
VAALGADSATVRRAALAHPGDLDAAARLFDGYRQFQGQPANEMAARDFLRARLERNESIVLLAQAQGRVIGFAQLYPSFSSVSLAPVLILNDLFVHQSGRGKKVASALLDAIESHAWQQGAVWVTLNVARLNTAAQAVYEARGWLRDQQFFMYQRFPG